MKNIKIGKIKFDSNVFLAPMFLSTDLPFRILCRQHGAGAVYSEMIAAKSLIHMNAKSLEMAKTSKYEKPNAIQIVGNNAGDMAKAAKIIEKNAAMIDLNFGCPSNDIMKENAGAALLKKPDEIYKITKSVVEAVNVPVTAKIRIGVNENAANSKENLKNSIKTAQLIEKAGASAIAVHARFASQKYSGKADWKYIAKIKKNLGIPIIGNGDIKDEESAKKMLLETNCDAIMIGRAAIGNPFIFERINHYIRTEKKLQIKDKQKINAYFYYLKLAEKNKVQLWPRAKMQALWFTKGISNSSKLRVELSSAKSADEIKEILKRIKI